jgi:hypothetical protein
LPGIRKGYAGAALVNTLRILEQTTLGAGSG